MLNFAMRDNFVGVENSLEGHSHLHWEGQEGGETKTELGVT